MKFVFEYLPIILFFVTYKVKDIFAATVVAIIASILLFAWIYFKGRRPNLMQWFSVIVIIVFGGATVVFKNPTFIMWKPSILYLLMGGSIVVAQHFFGRNLLQLLMGEQLELPAPVWNKLGWMWALFFLFMAALNLYVAMNYSQDFWVNFKLFGSIGLMILFVIGQSIYLAKHLPENNEHRQEQNPHQ